MGPEDYGEQTELLLNAKLIMSAVRGGIDNKKFRDDKQLMTACYNMMFEMYFTIIDLRKELEKARQNGTASTLIDPRNYLNGRTKDFNNGGAR